MKQLNTQDAIREVINTNDLSMYAIGKALSISPIMIGHYKYGRSKMSAETAAKFQELYDIKITDASRPGRPLKEQ
jgi:ribosome-binding protein aMBF1 (putative translation factor)